MNDKNNNILKQLVELLHYKINTLNEIRDESLNKSNEVENLLADLEKDVKIFSSSEFVKSLNKLIANSSLSEEEKRKLTINVDWLSQVLLKVSNVEKYDDLNFEEKVFVDNITDFLREQRNCLVLPDSVYTKYSSALNVAYGLLDKLRDADKGIKHFTEADLGLIKELLTGRDSSFKLDVQNLIYSLSCSIHQNIMSQMLDSPEIYVTEDVSDVEDVDSEVQNYSGNEELDLEALRNLFKANSLDFDDLLEKHQKQLAKCKFSRIKEILEYILANRDKDKFGYLFDNNRIINELKVYQILRYSNVDILSYLVKDSKNNGVELRKILDISGVFKKVSKKSDGETIDSPHEVGDVDYVSGSFEYYKNNCKTFERLTAEYAKQGIQIDCVKEAIIHIGTVLSRPDKIVAENVQIAKNFGMNLVVYKNGRYILNSLAYLGSTSLTESLIAVIENGLFDYISEYPSKLCNINAIKHLIRVKRNGELSFLPNGRIKDGGKIDGSLELRDPRINSNVAETYFQDLKLSEEFKGNLSKYELDLGLCHINDFIEQFDSEISVVDKKIYFAR